MDIQKLLSFFLFLPPAEQRDKVPRINYNSGLLTPYHLPPLKGFQLEHQSPLLDPLKLIQDAARRVWSCKYLISLCFTPQQLNHKPSKQLDQRHFGRRRHHLSFQPTRKLLFSLCSPCSVQCLSYGPFPFLFTPSDISPRMTDFAGHLGPYKFVTPSLNTLRPCSTAYFLWTSTDPRD